jgi:hypothetical protein
VTLKNQSNILVLLYNSILTCDVFELQLQSDVKNQLGCNLVMLMNYYFYCGMFGSKFYFGDVFESVLILVTCLAIAYLLVMCLNHVSKVMLINI